MRLSVIIVPAIGSSALDKVLAGYALQAWRDFEVVVAGPAGGPASELVAGRTRGYPVPLRHVASPDDGEDVLYCRAIAAAQGDCLLFTRDDCIPRPDLVAAHARLATPGRFLRGGSCRLGPGLSRQLRRNDIVLGRCFQPDWLQAQEPMGASSRRRLEAGPVAARLFDALRSPGVRFDPRNTSAWKDDLAAGEGGPAARLQARGVRGRNVEHTAVCLQLARAVRDTPLVEPHPGPQYDPGVGLARTRYG